MPKKSYGEIVEKRVKRLFEILLEHVAHCQCNDSDNDWGVQIVLEEEEKLLRVETNLAALVQLAAQKGEKLTKAQVREAIDHYLADYLGILRDERFKKQGSEEWRFSLTLWTRCGDKTTNLAKFSEEWHKRRSEPSKIAVATSEATARPSAPVVVTAVMDTDPPPVHDWQGRQTEINKLNEALDNNKLLLIGIVAAGGYGKSALAVKFTEQISQDWRVLWVSFTQAYGFAQFGRWLLENLQQYYDEKWHEETLIQQMVKGLTKEPCLLVLDNLETVVQAAEDSVYQQFLSRWLGSGNQSKILFTSREKPSFAPNLLRRCHWLDLEGLAEDDAIRLVRVDYGLTGTDEDLAAFVNTMGCHPMLMQLVCSLMVEQFGRGALVTAATELGLDLFSVPGYHRDTKMSVGEVVAASLARLSPRLGTLLKSLSVLRTAFDLSLAQGIDSTVTEAELQHIARLSLLQESPPEPLNNKPRQFQFLPLIQVFVQQQVDSNLLQSAHQLALDYYLAHLPSPPWESFAEVTAYLEAFYHAGALGDWPLAYDILNEERGGEGKDKSVDDFLDLQGFYRQRAKLYEQILAGSQWEQACYRHSLNRLGNCYQNLGQVEKAITYYQQSLDLSEAIGNRQGMAISLGNIGYCYYSLGQVEKAITYHLQHHDLSEAIGDRQGVANSLGNLGISYSSLGQVKKAIAHHQQHHDISEEIGNRQGVANSLGNLGLCYYSLGQYEKAIAHHQQSHDISEEIGNRQGVASSLGNLGLCYYSLGQYKKAIAHHQQHHDISEEIGNRQGVANSLGNLGLCYYSLGQYEKAIAHHQQSHDISEEIGNRQGVASSLGNLGLCYYSLGQYEKAIAHHQQSHDISEAIGHRRGVASALGNLGVCYYDLGQVEKAITYCQQHHELSEEIGDRRGVAISLQNIGEALINLENYSEAESKINEALVISQEIQYKKLTADCLKLLAEIAHKTNRPELALSHCQEALKLSQELGIPLVKGCEDLLEQIQ